MNAIIFAAGSDGEIHPHLGIGRELMARGHHVTFITTFDYVEIARESGFEVLSFLEPEEKQELLRKTEKLGAIAKIKSYYGFLTDKASEICEMVAGRLDGQSILIAPPFFYVIARLLHAKYGTPYVSTVLVPAHLHSLKSPPIFKSTQWYSRLPYPMRKLVFRGGELLIIDPFFRLLLKRPCRRLNLPRPRQIISKWWYSPQRVAGLFSEWFCPVPEDWPKQLKLTGFPLSIPNENARQLSDGLLQFLDDGPPPIVFNPGTETQNPRAFFEIALKIVQTLGARGIFLTRLVDHLPALPDTVWHESYPPFHLLLPRASALVHHGGIGTIALALRAGIPQLILPGWTDQLDNGLRAERLGCGLVQQDSLDETALLEKLQHLLSSPQVRETCRLTQARIEPGAKACSRVVDVIEETFHNSGK
ncbi:glycosyltransferase [Granulicella sp. S156]|uniref:glycosyltransferase n=1 Tax=Granulicella sp. S156 TaxID=1747224 RepID=UPI00131D78D5|nr:nucleotide disphospho-sugar-binding domain-containing protein [Granulicella sp. S156]